MATLTITDGEELFEDFVLADDYRSTSLSSIDHITFNTVEPVGAIFSQTQIGAGLSANTVITGDAQENFVIFQMTAAGTWNFDAATNFSFSNWTAGQDYIGLFGSAGADTITGSSANEYINGEFDWDGGSANDVLHGGAGDDILEGWGGVDQVYGEDGNDILVAYESDVLSGEIFSGGGGTDSLHVATAGSRDMSIVTLSSIEEVFVDGSGAGATSQTFFTPSQIGAGLSTSLHVIGGAGITDSITISAPITTGITLNLSGWTFSDWVAGVDYINLLGWTGADVLTGSSQKDVLVGGLGDDTLSGNAGGDTLDGGANKDTLDGGAGNDVMTGGDGDDTYIVDAAGDVTTEASGTGGVDLVRASVTRPLGANFENLTLTGADAINGTGNGGANTLIGNGAVNTLSGGGSNDILIGGVGADVLNGDGGSDTASYATSTARVRVNLNTGIGLDADAQGDTYNLIERLTGSDFNDQLTGDSVGNVLMGGKGVDILDGRRGQDFLFGGANNDVFVFSSGLGAADTIDDFAVGADKIRLENGIFTGLAAGTLASSAFNTGAAASDGSDRIIYDSATGFVYFDRDGTGAQTAIHFATLDAGLGMSNTDFVVI